MGFTTFGSVVENGQIITVTPRALYSPDPALVPYFEQNGGMVLGQQAPTLPIPGPSWLGQNASNATRMPFSLQHSPVIWLILAVLIGYLGLEYIHWGR